MTAVFLRVNPCFLHLPRPIPVLLLRLPRGPLQNEGLGDTHFLLPNPKRGRCMNWDELGFDFHVARVHDGWLKSDGAGYIGIGCDV